MFLPGTPNMTYDIVNDFFQEYKSMFQIYLHLILHSQYKSLPKIKFMRLWFMQDSMEVN